MAAQNHPAVKSACREIPESVATAFAEATEGYLAEVWLLCDSPPDTVSLPLDPAFEIPAPRDAFTLYDCSDGAGCIAYQSAGIAEDQLTYTSSGERGPTCAVGCAFAQTRTRSRLPVYLLLCGLFAGIAAIGALIILYIARQQAMAEQADATTSL